MADPDAHIGFCFTMNNMQEGMVSAGSTPTKLIDAFYEALASPDASLGVVGRVDRKRSIDAGKVTSKSALRVPINR